jgi:5-methylcytosine-specific restriction endonuclease McrA
MKRLRIYMRDKFRCQYCGEKEGRGELTLDHILPRSRGGDNSPVNIVTLASVQQPEEQSHSGRSTHAFADFADSACA